MLGSALGLLQPTFAKSRSNDRPRDRIALTFNVIVWEITVAAPTSRWKSVEPPEFEGPSDRRFPTRISTGICGVRREIWDPTFRLAVR
jgi:hypothetical protein